MARKANSAERYMAETIRMAGVHSDLVITRADCHAAYLAAGHDARTADQFAFGWADRREGTPHPMAREAMTAMLSGDMNAFRAMIYSVAA
jgi:hypothetical protein